MEQTSNEIGDAMYETQFYGFTSDLACIAVLESAFQILDIYMDGVKGKLNEKYHNQTDVYNFVTQLSKIYVDRLKGSSDEIRDIVKQHFCIPANVLLPEDECQRNRYSPEDVVEIKQKIADAQKRLAELDKKARALQSTDGLETEYRDLIDKLEKQSLASEKFMSRVINS